MSLIEKRYAEALINIAVQQQAIDTFLQDLGTFVKMYSEEPGFKAFLLNPQNKILTKKDVIKKAFSSTIKTEIISFVSLLLDKGRLKHLPDIYEEYVKQADEKRNILNIEIISATPLDAGQINIINDKYMKLYKATAAKSQVQVDASLIGGIIVVIGDKVTDASIKGRLKELQQLLVK